MKFDGSSEIFCDRRLIKTADLYQRLPTKHHVRTAAKHGILRALSLANIFVENHLLQPGGSRYAVGFEVAVILRGLNKCDFLVFLHYLDQTFSEVREWVHVRVENGDIFLVTGGACLLVVEKFVAFRWPSLDKV